MTTIEEATQLLTESGFSQCWIRKSRLLDCETGKVETTWQVGTNWQVGAANLNLETPPLPTLKSAVNAFIEGNGDR